MPDRGRVRVYIASSLDGFIAGPDDDLSWLSSGSPEDAPPRDPGAVGYEDFMAEVGALLMGRRTYDVVRGFEGDWPYGDRPVLVATHRPLAGAPPSVRAATGPIEALVAQALEAAAGRDVYLDGGDLIRQALDGGLVDEAIVTVAPIVLGAGQPLFAGVTRRHRLDIVGHDRFDAGMVQLHLRPRTMKAPPTMSDSLVGPRFA